MVLASPKLRAGSKRSVQVIPWHTAIPKNLFCPTRFNTALLHGLTMFFPEPDSWEKKKEEEGGCVTAAGEFKRSSQSVLETWSELTPGNKNSLVHALCRIMHWVKCRHTDKKGHLSLARLH